MTAEILGDREIEKYIGSYKLIPAKGGVFEVMVNGELIFSKKALKRHAEAGEVKALVIAALDRLYPNRPPAIPDADS